MVHLARNLTAVQNATAQVASFSPKFCYFKTVSSESLVRSDLITPNRIQDSLPDNTFHGQAFAKITSNRGKKQYEGKKLTMLP